MSVCRFLYNIDNNMNAMRYGSGLVLFLIMMILTAGNFIWAQTDLPEIQTDNSQMIQIEILNEIVQHLEKRDFPKALHLFDSLPPEEAAKTPVRIMQATVLISAGRTAEAKSIANSILTTDSANTDAIMVLADAAAVENKPRERRVFLDRIISINPHHVRALNDLGNISLGNRNLRIAAGYFDRALAADPDNGEALVNRASVYRYAREQQNAERLLNRAIGLYPKWARPFHERARLYRSAQLIEDALEDLNAALALEPNNYWILVDHGSVLVDLQRKPEALQSFNRAIRIEPNIFMAYVYSAGIKDELGDYAGAEHDYSVLARLRPDYYFAFEALGVLRMRNKQWAPARDAFLEAYKQAPKEYSYAILASLNWMRAGRQTDPKQFLAQVLRTAPRDSLDHAMMRVLHDLSGDIELAGRIEKEQNVPLKTRMMYYMASFYDIRGSRTLADRYFLMVKDINTPSGVEWILNEMAITERKLIQEKK